MTVTNEIITTMVLTTAQNNVILKIKTLTDQELPICITKKLWRQILEKVILLITEVSNFPQTVQWNT